MADIIPIDPELMTLQDRSVTNLINAKKSQFFLRHARQPHFIVIGGNFVLKLLDEFDTFKREERIRAPREIPPTLFAMTVVKVMVDILECGE